MIRVRASQSRRAAEPAEPSPADPPARAWATALRRAPALAAGAAAVAALAVLATADVGDRVSEAIDALGLGAYALVGVMAFLETGVPVFAVALPGELTVALGGALAARGEVELVPIVLLVWGASLLGDTCSYATGRWLGAERLRSLPRAGLAHRFAERYRRFGGASLVVCRFLPVIRPLSPFVAGAIGLPVRSFVVWAPLATAAFAVAFTLAGYAAYRSYEEIVARSGLAMLALVAGAGLAAFAAARLRRRRAR